MRFQRGHACWNTGMKGQEMLSHFKKPLSYTETQRNAHKTPEFREKMRKARLKALSEGRGRHICSDELREANKRRMIANRQDIEFNKKMFASLTKSITKPHLKVKQWIREYTELQTISNYPFRVGTKVGEIDEADPLRKVAIFVDGNYWHNYPNLRTWDKCCNSCLENNGWKVMRFWESDINNNSERIITLLGGVSK
jgi:very-short-patch-repair endonuclease